MNTLDCSGFVADDDDDFHVPDLNQAFLQITCSFKMKTFFCVDEASQNLK